MRRCRFLGPHLGFFRRWQPDPLLCVLCFHSLCPRTSRRGTGLFAGARAESCGPPPPRHRRKRCFSRTVGVGAGAGAAPRRQRPRLCVGVCPGSDPTPAGGAGCDPRGGGASARAPPGEDFTAAAAAAALVCSVTSPGLLPPSREGRARRARLPSSPPWPPSRPTPLFSSLPRSLIFPR